MGRDSKPHICGQAPSIPADAKRFSLALRVQPDAPRKAVDFLALHCSLSKRTLKEVFRKGGVWIIKNRQRARRRLRRATAEIRLGDELELHYDQTLLARKAPGARCLLDRERYSVWLKPKGLLSQGTNYGDHCSLLRQIEVHLRFLRPALLVHRLDRETEGLVMIAHDKAAAAKLSSLFRMGDILKRYRAEILGDLRQNSTARGTITKNIAGKIARTDYEVLGFDAAMNLSRLEIVLHSGRTHQIRRHLAAIGHPLIGDPRYGSGNKNTDGLRLVAHTLEWICPFSGSPERVAIDPELFFQGVDPPI